MKNMFRGQRKIQQKYIEYRLKYDYIQQSYIYLLGHILSSQFKQCILLTIIAFSAVCSIET